MNPTARESCWNPEAETMPLDRLRGLQARRLSETVQWAYDRVPFYRARLDETGVRPDAIRSTEDLPRLPFTSNRL